MRKPVIRKNQMPRLLFAALRSGSGKTLVTCGMIEILKKRGYGVVSFKCGPDYIDPMFHRQVLGIPSGNLDTFFTDEKTTRELFYEQAVSADISVIEGVMGYYDGLGGSSEQGSTYEVAKVTGTPVILIVDAKGASVSLAAQIKGMLTYREDSGICGVILNRVSAGYYGRLKEVIERECTVPVLGLVPELPSLQVPSRHLGLISPREMKEFESWIFQTASVLEEHVDVDELLRIARQCSGGSLEEDSEKNSEKNSDKNRERKGSVTEDTEKLRIAVARDEAFSFYYEENIRLLKKMGAQICYFSPIHDRELPGEIDGLILGGGYPERYAKELEAAEAMRTSIRTACEKGLPCLAECGGFLYLQRELEDEQGRICKMAGLLPGRAYRREKLTRFGYVEAEIRRGGLLGEPGECFRGHEFHYWDCTETGGDFLAEKPLGNQSYPCMVHRSRLAAGFPHFYYENHPHMIRSFLETCRGYRAGRKAKEHWDGIAKPIDSLGLLEEDVVRLCRMRGSAAPFTLDRRALLVLCADHGVVSEGVTQTGSEVTRIVSENFAKGCSTVNYLAACANVDVYTVDMGMDTLPYPQRELVLGEVIDRKVARGTQNLARGAAMSMEQCIRAVETGKELVRELVEKGYRIIATGEMGIGNTTPASVLAAVFLQQEAETVTGKGAGLSQEGLSKKCRVVQAATDRIREGGLTDPMEILAQAGGYEIAGMVGIFLGGVRYHIPIIIDGAISAAAALTALQMDDRVRDYVIASHEPKEEAGRLALRELGVEALIHGRLCLGEGSGAMAVLPLLDMALKVYGSMGTFTEYEITPYTRFEGGD